MRFLSDDEVWKLADVITDRYRALVLTGAFTGLRPGELFGLTVDRLGMLRRTAQVDRQLKDERGKVWLGPLKTAASNRKITLPSFLVDELAAHIAEFGLGPDGLIFTAPRGGPIHKDTFPRRAWIPAVTASVGLPMRPHDWRHTHAALLIEQGQHPKVIQARLGHESIKTTLDQYGHLMDGLDESAADSLDEAYSPTQVLNGEHQFASS